MAERSVQGGKWVFHDHTNHQPRERKVWEVRTALILQTRVPIKGVTAGEMVTETTLNQPLPPPE